MTDIRQGLKEKLGVDLDGACRELCLPAASFERVLRVSVATTEAAISELDSAAARGDAAQIERLTHDLKGVFANLRITPLSHTALLIHEHVKAGRNIGLVLGKISEFKDQFNILKQVLT